MPHVNLDEYGPLPVILPEEQKRAPAAPVDLDRFQTFSEQRGALTMPRQTAIERPDVPEALQAIEQNIIAPAGGIAAAAPLLPIAGITGVGAGALPFTESAAFSAGTIGTEALLRQLNKALGYRVPKAPSVGERGIEAGATALAYPMGNIPSLLKIGAENVLGLTAREQARSKAATEMSSKLAKLPDLHGRVADIADRIGGQISSAMSAAEKQAVRQGRETAATAGKRMVAGVPPVASEAELAASGRDLSAAAELRTRTIGQLGTLYNRKQAALGAEYETLYEPYMKMTVPDDTLKAFAAKAEGIRTDAQQYESLPGQLKGIINEVAGWGEDKSQEIREKVTAEFAKKYAARPQGARGKAAGPVDPRITAGLLSSEPIKAEMEAEIAKRIAEEKPQVTFARLKQIRGDVRRYFDGKNAPARHASQSVDRAVLEAYGDADLPQNPDLNARYRVWRDRWTWQNVRALRHVEDPAQLSRLVNQRMLEPLLDVADQPQTTMVKRLIAQTIRNENLSPTDIIQRFPAPVLRAHFGAGADDVANWQRVEARGNQLTDMLQADPALRQSLMQKQNQEARRLLGKASRDVKKSVVGWLDKLGTPAADLAKQVREMSPEQATAFYLQRMRSPEFGQQLIEAARTGTPLPAPKTLPGLGSLSFALGLGTMELLRRGEVTSPYVLSVPFALGLEAFTGKGRDLIVRLVESDGMAATMRMLDRVANPVTRKPATALLAKRLAQIGASDVLRGITAPYEEEQQ